MAKLIEQKITKKVIVAGGEQGSVSVNIPSGRTAFLKGYGTSWSDNSEFQLVAGSLVFPRRDDQEGSLVQPMFYGEPFPIGSGQSVKVNFFNNDVTSNTYYATFYLLVDDVLLDKSEGGQLVVPTSATAELTGNLKTITGSVTALENCEVAQGAVLTGKSVLIAAGKSGSNAYPIAVDASGNVQVDIVNTPAVSISGNVGIDPATNAVTIDNATPIDVTNVQDEISSLGEAAASVTTAGTRVQLGSHACKKCVVRANDANTGKIFVGSSSVSSANAGIQLIAGSSYEMNMSNTNLLYIDSEVNGEGVTYTYFN